ncbi:MAG: enolase C-terminal domain-like protein [Dehalococcoidia bacterium]
MPSWRTHFWQIVVRVESDAGVAGLGYGGGGVASVEIVNRHFRELLLGRDVNNIAHISAIWDDLYDASMPYGRKGLAIMALSGVDLALYDLLGKAERKPVYEVLGGAKKSRVFSYATGQDAELYHRLGYQAHKFSHRWTGAAGDYDIAVDTAARAREIFGPDALLMIDTYMSWNRATTVEMAKRLSEFNLYWYEDVLNPDDLQGQAELRPLVEPTLIAGGEHEFTQHGFSEIARTQALGLWQPDITWCGGLTAGRRIVELGRESGIPVSPHRGGEIWGLHLIVASDCADLAEYHSDHIRDQRDVLWLDEPHPVEGYIAPTDRPGFGVTLNETML